MARYKLWLPGPSETITWDDGDVAIAAQTAEEALRYLAVQWDEHGCWLGWHDDGVGDGWIHPQIASGRIVYKRDIDAEDGFLHEGAEPGETTFALLNDTDRDLADHEVRVWFPGPPRPHWMIQSPWATGTPYHLLTVGGESWSIEGLEAAEAARKERSVEWVARWKAAHPECRSLTVRQRVEEASGR